MRFQVTIQLVGKLTNVAAALRHFLSCNFVVALVVLLILYITITFDLGVAFLKKINYGNERALLMNNNLKRKVTLRVKLKLFWKRYDNALHSKESYLFTLCE